MASTLFLRRLPFISTPKSSTLGIVLYLCGINPFVSKASTFRYHPWGINPRVRSLFVLRDASVSTLSMLLSILGSSTLLVPCVPTMCFYTTYPCVHALSHANHPISCIPTIPFSFNHYVFIHPLTIHYINSTYLSFNYYCNQTQHINPFSFILLSSFLPINSYLSSLSYNSFLYSFLSFFEI